MRTSMHALLVPFLAITLLMTAGRCPAAEHAGMDAALSRSALPADKPLDEGSIYQLDSKWTRADGQKVALSSLRGKVRVLAIFYSSCQAACPILVGRMKALQASLPDNQRGDVGFVLVSMDAAHDDPARLAEYAKRMQLEGDWTLLQGEDPDVRELAALLGFRYRQETDGGFSHSNMISILDREGRLAHQTIGLEEDVSDAAKAVAKVLGP